MRVGTTVGRRSLNVIIQKNQLKMNTMENRDNRERPVWKQKVFYLTNHIKFYSIHNPIVTIFYFLTQSLALLSTFGDSPIFDPNTLPVQIINQLNSVFYFYTNATYRQFDKNLYLSHVISLLLLVLFAVIAYFAYSINHLNKIVASKSDDKKIMSAQIIIFLIISLNIPLGSFISYYFLNLIKTGMPYLIPLPLLNLAGILWLVYIVQECSIETNLKDYCSLSRLYSQNESVHSMVKMIIRMVVASFNNLTDSIIIISLFILLVFDLYQLRITIFSKKYLNSLTESMYGFKNICVVIMEVLMIMIFATSMPLIIHNFFLATLVTSILGFFSLQNFKQYKKRNLTFQGLVAVRNEDDAKIYMLQSIGMLDQKKNYEQIFTLGLITIHKQQCNLDLCFCTPYRNDSNQKLVKKGEFIKKLVLNKLQKVVQKFPKSFLIISILLNYKLSMMSSFSKIYYLLKHFIQQNQENVGSFSQQYMMYQMEVIIQQEIHKNLVTTQVEVQKIFKEDTLKVELTKLLNHANDKLIDKYRLLSQEICNLNIVQKICVQITECLREIQSRWACFREEDSYNLKIYQIFLIYFQFMIYCRKQVTWVKNTIVRKTQSLRHLKGINQDNLQRYLYTNRACVIESVFNKDKIGVITNVSASCAQLFKLNRDQLVGKDIHQLMPEYLSAPHRRWSKQWLDNETLTGKLLGIVDTVYVDANFNCFTASLHMKISSVGFKLKFYIMMIRDNSNDYLIMDQNCQIQGIGYRLQNQQIFDKMAIKKPMTDYCDFDFKTEMMKTDTVKRRIVFSNQIKLDGSQRKMAFAIIEASSQMNIDKLPETYVYECQVLIEKKRNAKFVYYCLKFMQIRKLIKQNTNHFYFQTIADTISNIDFQVKKNANNPTNASNIQHQNSKLRDQAESSNKKDSEVEEGQNMFDLNQISSVTDSVMGDSNIVFSKLIQEIKQKTIDPTKSIDFNLTITTVLVSTLTFVVIGCAIIQPFIFQLGIGSFSQIIASSNMISDNNMLLEIAYNRELMMTLYCYSDKPADIHRCQYLWNSTNVLTTAFYNSAVGNFNSYYQKTQLTGLKFYSGYDKMVAMKLNDDVIVVSLKEFVEYFYYALAIIKLDSRANATSRTYQQDHSYLFLYQNWNVIKSINKQAMQYYHDAGDKQLSILLTLIYLLSALFILMLIGLLVCCKIYYIYMQNKKQNIVKLYNFLNHSTCNYLKQVGENIKYCLKYSYSQINLEVELHKLRESKQKSQVKYNKNHKFNYFLIILLFILSSLNISALVSLNSLFVPASTIISTVDKLIESQKHAFEAYIQLKTFYMQFTFNKSKQQFNTQIQKQVQQVETVIATHARESIGIFSTLDSLFQTNFNNLLVYNICKMTSQFFPLQWQQKQCNSGMHFNLIKQGVIASMTFLQRTTLKTLKQLNQTSTDQNYFHSYVFEDIDDSLFYLFRAFQLTHTFMIQELGSASSSLMSTVIILVLLEVSVLLLMLCLWLLRLQGEKKRMSNLYGSVLQLPQIMFKQNKLIMRIIEQNLTLKI